MIDESKLSSEKDKCYSQRHNKVMTLITMFKSTSRACVDYPTPLPLVLVAAGSKRHFKDENPCGI